MKASRTFPSTALMVFVALAMMSTIFAKVTRAQEIELHGGGISKSVVGTNTLIGTNITRVGDFVTATITVQNIDQVASATGTRRADSLRIDMVIDLVMHGMHTVASPNLLDGNVKLRTLIYGSPLPTDPPTGTNIVTLIAPHSVILTNLGDSLTVTHTYQVLPGEDDPTNLVNGFLTDLAVVMGADLRNCTNCPTAPGVPDDFLLQFPGGILVVPQLGAIGDFVWDDRNRDGLQSPGEPGLSNMTVALQDCAGNVVSATVTDAAGKYLFEGLPAGDYRVFFVPPANYVFTTPNVGSDDLDSDSDSGGLTSCITLAAGQTNLTVDAGLFQPPAAVGDFVWNDLNRDGSQTAGEPGLPGLTVTLETCAGVVVTNTVTGAGGRYLISGVPAGDYQVRFSAPAGYVFTSPNIGSDDLDSDPDATGLTACINLISGQTNLTVDAGLFQPRALLGDFVWNDTNRDGRQGAGEPGIPGVTVILQDCAGTTVTATVTGADGKYLFSDLAAGSYRVKFNAPVGFTFAPPNVGSDDLDSDADTNGITSCFTLVSGQTNLTVDAGLFEARASLGDFVWDDQNRDGRQGVGEPGIPGATVILQDCAGATVTATVTGADGKYLFSDLPAGNYRVKFNAPAGYVFTSPNVGSDDLDSDADTNGLTACITLTAGQANLTVDAGLFVPRANLGDFVWDDRNHDGRQGVGEPGIPGATVILQDCAGATIATTVTGADGKYAFNDLAPGSYRVKFNAPTNFNFTLPNVGSDDLDSDADTNGLTACITLAAGQGNVTVDAGLFAPVAPAAVGDYVWNDLNRDGCQDLGEPGIAGVTVTLQNCTGTVLASKVTDANGKYLFDGLAAGSYRIVFSKPSGQTFTLARVAACGDDLDSDPDPATGITPCFTLIAGQRNLNVDAGLYIPECGAIGDFVWEDRNCNGVQDSGEPGLSGVQIYLTDCAGTILSVAFSDGAGHYAFANLAAGDYKVVFLAPPNTTFAPKVPGNPTRDSNADASGLTDCFTLGACETNLTVDAGLCPPAGECCVREVTRAISDPDFNPHGSDHAIWIPGISTNLIFYPDPGSFRECPDGTATLTGRIASLTNFNAGFDVNVVFSGRRSSPPSGSPKEDLETDAYENHGGPVDSDTWYYYTTFSGTLTGFGLYEGAIITLTRSGPAFQIGVGANNKNVLFGASGWFDWTREHQPNAGRFPASGKGDFNVDLGPCIPEAAPLPVRRPVLNTLVQSSNGQKSISVAGPTGRYYLIECSIDLSMWKPLAIVRNSNGALNFSDRAANSQCFYRVKMVP